MELFELFISNFVYNDTIIEISVPKEFSSACTCLISSFSRELSSTDEYKNIAITPIVVYSLFLSHCASRDVPVAKATFNDFESKFIYGKEIHTVCNDLKLSNDQVYVVLKGYYSAWDLIPADRKPIQRSALLTSKSTKILALFGGQDGSNSYFDELVFLYQVYHPIVASFVKEASSFLTKAISCPQIAGLYGYGLEFDVWLENPESAPPPNYLLSSPVSLPLTGVTQLLRFLVTFKTLGITPGELSGSFEASAGHSHGIVVATVISCLTDEKSFYMLSMKALGILLLICTFGQIACPLDLPSAEKLNGSNEPDISAQRPMASIQGLDNDQLNKLIVKFNSKQSNKNRYVYISAINTPNAFSISGHTISITKFIRLIRSEYRSSNVNAEYLGITVPYNCELLDNIVSKQHKYAVDNGWTLCNDNMRIPVRASDDGHDIRCETNLTKYLFRSTMVLPVNWPVAINHPGTTHIVDFGTGGTRGVSALTRHNIEGRGISIICASAVISENPIFGTRADFYKSELSSINKAPNWSEEFLPTLVRTSFDNNLHISTKMSRLLGKPPVIISGMMPNTVNEGSLPTILSSKYHVEFSCRGIQTEHELNSKLNKLVESVELGCGITLDCNYLNTKQWSFQFSAIVESCRKGVPIEGLCISGDIPSLDIVADIINTIQGCGIYHISFKPSSVESIHHIINISKASPKFPIILQFINMCENDHDSFEKFHQPILSTYRAIRERDNIILVSGFWINNVDDALSCFTGEWSTRLGYAPMPFDGILFGSHIVVAKRPGSENLTNESIVSVTDLDYCGWEQAGSEQDCYGVIVKSEFGEPIHAIRNRCSVFWKELDNTIFSVPRKDRLQAILNKRDYIINHLNRDHTRPWFGTMVDGRIIDIEDMTYLETINNLVDHLYIESEGKWIDPSYKKLFNLFLLRTEERFANIYSDCILSVFGVFDIHERIKHISCKFPDIGMQLLTSEDARYLIELCEYCDQKPVPFIPILDENFETWFKKDIIWQSEELIRVPNQDIQRVLVIEGQVAAWNLIGTNIASKGTIDEFYSKLVDKIIEKKYNSNSNDVRTVGYLSNDPSISGSLNNIAETVTDYERMYILSNDKSSLPGNNEWASILSGNQLNWLYALLKSPSIIDGYRAFDNTIRTLLRPRINHSVRVCIDGSSPASVEVFDEHGLVMVNIYIDKSNIVNVSINNHLKGNITSLTSKYQYNPGRSFFHFSRLKNSADNSEAKFYKESIRIGVFDSFVFPKTIETNLSSSYSGHYIDPHCFVRYLEVLGHSTVTYEQRAQGVFFLPVDYIFVLAFPTISDCITKVRYCDRALSIVYQSNTIRFIANADRLYTGDTISSSSRIVSVLDTAPGEQIKIATVITRDNVTVAEVKTVVVLRNIHCSPEEQFSDIDGQSIQIKIRGKEDLAVLRSKQWFVPDTKAIHLVGLGSILQFSLETQNNFKSYGNRFSSSTTGEVNLILSDHKMIKIGCVEYFNQNTYKNAVIEYLKRFGTFANQQSYFDDDGYQLYSGGTGEGMFISAPQSNMMYSQVSGDYNPVYTNSYISDYIGLPSTVVHSTHISALVRSYIDKYAANNHPERVIMYDVIFGELVSPQDKLIPSFNHIGMKGGCMLIKGKTVNQRGNVVLEFTAEVEQPPTVYLFTGQGSQYLGIGMDLYESSNIARSIWDKGDAYMFEKYGISILDVIRRNPTYHTIYFNGVKGSRIRNNYIGLIPEVDENTQYYTFSSEKGLLALSQIIQPVLSLFDLALVEDMNANNLIYKPVKFAGHSFGELAAICTFSQIFSLEDMLDIMFYRGLVLELAAKHDDNSGCPKYRIAAINPSLIGSNCTVNDLNFIIEAIKHYKDGLLEIINHNVEGQQYAVTGTVSQLKVLSITLDRIQSRNNFDQGALEDTIIYAVKQVSDERNRSSSISLERSSIFIPIKNISVPSHSSCVLPFVEQFRNFLMERLKGKTVVLDNLCSRYIPNIIGTPFEISQEYFRKVYSATKSTLIRAILDDWDDTSVTDNTKRHNLAQTLFIELIAYQIACPVQWILTQKYLLNSGEVERFIEIGPSTVLSDMMGRSARAMDAKMTIYSTVRNKDEIYFRNVNETKGNREDTINDIQKKNNSTNLALQTNNTDTSMQDIILPQLQLTSVNRNPAHVSDPVPDIPLDLLSIVRVIVAQKLRKRIDDIVLDKSIDYLTGGKSVLRNEIVGEIRQEFGASVPEIIDEMSIEEIAASVKPFSGALGSYTESQISRILRSKLPGGFTKSLIISYLNSTYCIGPMCCDGVMLFALVNEPPIRLSNDTTTKSWIDTLVSDYAKIHKIELCKLNMASSAGSTDYKAFTVEDMKMLEKIQVNNKQMITRVVEILASSIGIDLRRGDRISEGLIRENAELKSLYDNIMNTVEEESIRVVKPMFDPFKVRYFNSYWNWVCQDLLELFYNLIVKGVDIDSTDTIERVSMLKNRSSPALINLFSFCIKSLKDRYYNGLSVDMKITFLSKVYNACQESISSYPIYESYKIPQRPCIITTGHGASSYSEMPTPEISTHEDYIKYMRFDCNGGRPLIFIESTKNNDPWEYDSVLTNAYLESVSSAFKNGISFNNKCVLITGCMVNPICEGILKGVLSGGAKVIITIADYSRKTILYFEDIYRRYGSRGSELIVVPLNQRSIKDIKQLVKFIYGSFTKSGSLGWELDIIIPFAEPPAQLGKAKNLYNILSDIVTICSDHKRSTKIVQVIVPYLPNHDRLRGDGVYGEAKIEFETLIYHWRTRSWSDYISIAAVFVGWVREAKPMKGELAAVAVGLEKRGIYTFSADEMAMCMLSSVSVLENTNVDPEPTIVNLSGGLLRGVLSENKLIEWRNDISKDAHRDMYISADMALDFNTEYGVDLGQLIQPPAIRPRSNIRLPFPKYKQYRELSHLHNLQGMVNLDKVVVVTGFGEVGPYGNAKTRWEMEAYGEFSLEGCIELAWVMGYIKFFSGILEPMRNEYTGWIDAKTGEPVDDIDVKVRYEKDILSHTGIRLIEPELHDGYNPNKKLFMRELQIEHDMEPFEASSEEAKHLRLQHGDRVDIWQSNDGVWLVRLLRGAVLMVPKALRFDRTVASQIPTGWDPVRYGIPSEIADQVDPVTCYALIATVEALLRSGITDPYELYSYFHVSKVGNTVGSGLGGISSISKMYTGRLIEDSMIQSDVLQEAYLNSTPAWINMLLLSSSGPIKPVSGSCATSALSIDVAIDTIQCGKAKVVIAGGTDDFQEALSYEYGNMGATSKTTTEELYGRTPTEMSRPCTSTRNGFMEGEGAGILVLMSASAAVEMGVPIYGIIALSNTATDKTSRSVPAPGKGLLTTASESNQFSNTSLIDLDYRRSMLEEYLLHINQIGSNMKNTPKLADTRVEEIRKALQDKWGNEFWKGDDTISPLRGALAVWGLDADDIGVVSLHGTSTDANDTNESEIFNTQFQHIGRTPGNAAPVITQKWLTGHPKGGAAAWMLNGLLQVLDTGLIPGNRNADNIEEKLEQFEYLVYPSKSIQTPGIKAGLLKSFGFGQVGGEMLVLHPDYILATLSCNELEQYQKKVRARENCVYRYLHNVFIEKHAFVQIKDEPPYTKEQEQDVYLDSNARAKYNTNTKKYYF